MISPINAILPKTTTYLQELPLVQVKIAIRDFSVQACLLTEGIDCIIMAKIINTAMIDNMAMVMPCQDPFPIHRETKRLRSRALWPKCFAEAGGRSRKNRTPGVGDRI